MQLKSNLWSCEIQKSEIPKECLEEEVIVGIDEAGRGPVMGTTLLRFFMDRTNGVCGRLLGKVQE